MKLSEILSRVKTDFKIIGNAADIEQIDVADISLDSRLVKNGSVFFALRGKASDGSAFISDAIKRGAIVVVSEVAKGDLNRVEIISANASQLLSEFLQIFYSPLPANIYAITGTNGKTSTAEFVRQILQFLEKKSASIGTLGIMSDVPSDCFEGSSLTTPDIVSLYKNLHILKKNSVDDVAIEVSSIGLEQGRIAGLKIAVGAFTNFTQDHLDYHQSMEEYLRCKMILFKDVLSKGGVAVFNADIDQAKEIEKISKNRALKTIDYGFKAHDLRLLNIEPLEFGQKVFFEYRQKKFQFELSVGGDFQAMNALCALGNVLVKNNLSEDALANLLNGFSKLQPALGRMQRVAVLQNKAQIFIDFAHTPDALINVLGLGRQIAKSHRSRLILLFGCGGDRDAKKRPIMGKIACDLADRVIVTDDNPRTETASTIRAEILAACDMSKAVEIPDRKVAIEKVIAMLEPRDVLILAGKGHEKYQIIGKEKFEFDEEKIVKNVIRKPS